MTQPIPKEFEDYKLHDVEIRYGIVQVSCHCLNCVHRTIVFFHCSALRRFNLSAQRSEVTSSKHLTGIHHYQLQWSLETSRIRTVYSRLSRWGMSFLCSTSTLMLSWFTSIGDVSIPRVRRKCSISDQSSPGLHGTRVLHDEKLWQSVRYVFAWYAHLCPVQSWSHVVRMSWQLFVIYQNVRRSQSIDDGETIGPADGSAWARENVAQLETRITTGCGTVRQSKRCSFRTPEDSIKRLRCHSSKMSERRPWNTSIPCFKWTIFNDQCSIKVFLKWSTSYPW